MRALNKAWIASGTGNLHKLVFDEETKEWVLPNHTAAANRKRKATCELARRPRRTRNACRVDLLRTASPSQPGRGADKFRVTWAQARRPRRTRNACHVDALTSRPRAHVYLFGTASPSQPGRGADRWKDAMSKRTPAQQAPRRRPNHPRGTNSSSHVLHVPSQEASTNKRSKTLQDNKLAAAQNGTKHDDPWSSDELKKLLKAFEACGNCWKDVAARVGSRSAGQCRQ